MTKPVPLMIAGGLLLWSWQTGYWLVGVPLAILLEGPRFTTMRWELDKRDFNRIVDTSVLLFLATTFYFVNSERSFQAFSSVLIWLPPGFLLLIAAQKYSIIGTVPLTSLFFSLRWLEARRAGELGNRQIDLTLPYTSVCLLSASAADQRTAWFYPAVFLLIAWGLWFQRSRRFRVATWIGMVVTAGAVGYGVMTGFEAGRAQMQHLVIQWFKDYRTNRTDPYHSNTALGYIGTLKLSDDILFRVETESQEPEPILLRDASYNLYSRGIWFAEETEFKKLESDADATTWRLSTHQGGAEELRVSAQTNAHGDGLLMLPNGAFRLEGIPVTDMRRNGLGAVKIENGPPLISYRVEFDPDLSIDDPPDELDTYVTPSLEDLIENIARELGLDSMTPEQAVARIAAYFSREFAYSLTQGELESDTSPLQNFLLSTKAGHCEFYATATVLLLRQAGIPARYATGYSVQEYSWLEEAYLVRKRHGHAWALANVGGRWIDIDNTPTVWRELEGTSRSVIQPLADVFSWVKHSWQRWRWGAGPEEDRKGFIVWALVPLVLLLAWRLSRKRRNRATSEVPQKTVPPVPCPGSDSPFYAVIEVLDRTGYTRAGGESMPHWLERLRSARPIDDRLAGLEGLLAIHNKYRFDPRGISSLQRETLEAGVREWLNANR